MLVRFRKRKGLKLFSGLLAVLVATTPVYAESFEMCIKKIRKASVMKSPCDPFDGQVWHAAQSSWPGTMTFNHKHKTVVLEPLSVAPIHAKYQYTVNPVPTKGAVDEITGTLTLTDSQNRTSKAEYQIKGRGLILRYPELAGSEEHYLRMSKAEEVAEMARIKELLSSGKLNPLGIQPQ